MADRTLVITWGAVVRGREERAMENFNEAVGYYGRLQQDGKIEKFGVTLLGPNATLDGFMQLEGTADQIRDVREDPEFQRITAQSVLIVDDLCVLEGYVNDGVASQMTIFAEAIAKVPQAV